MKPLILLKKPLVLLCVICISPFFSYAQPAPDYIFASPVLLSGTNLQPGAVYRFSNVKAGVDAIVTILTTVNATLTNLDATGQGWNAAFQPAITVPSMQTGYVEFKIDFVIAGTFTLMNQPQVAVTALDVDGYNFSANQKLYEFEQFDLGGPTYVEFDFLGTDISITFNQSAVLGTNVGGVDYGSINLSQNVRFTCFRSNVKSLLVRSGAHNQDVFNNVNRQRSFYFARFTYPNSMVLLDAPALLSFTGTIDQHKAVQLKWKLAQQNTVNAIEVEHSVNGQGFATLQQLSATGSDEYVFTDAQPVAGMNYYRLKLIGTDGLVQYSQVVKVSTGSTQAFDAQLSPTICISRTKLQFNSPVQTTATVQLTGYNGKVYYNRVVDVQQGDNQVDLNFGTAVPAGMYMVRLVSGEKYFTGKIVVAR